MTSLTVCSRLLRALVPAVLVLLGAAAMPRALAAVTPDQLVPANLVGKTVQYRYSGNRTFETNLSLTNNTFEIRFLTATTYIRSGSGLPGISTATGTYTVVSTAEQAGIRTTALFFNSNFTSLGSTTPVTLTMVSETSAVIAPNFAISSNGQSAAGTYGFVDGGTGGGSAGEIPTITSFIAPRGTIGTPYTFQLTATESPTRYAATGLPAGLSINTTTGLISGNIEATVSAINAAGSATIPLSFTIAAGSSSGGSAGGSGSTVVARSVTGWGWNLSGQISVPTSLTNVIALGAGGQTGYAVRSDGTVVSWGGNAQTAVPAGLSGVVAVTGGSNHSVALKSDGSVVQWGLSADGQRNNFPSNNTGFTAVSAKYFHTLGLKSDGTVVVWGTDPAFGGLTQPPAGLTGVKAIAAGVGFDLALKTDGTVVAWASPTLATFSDNKGQANVPAGLSNVTAIAAGQFHALALKADGTVVGWGGASRSGPANSFVVPTNAASGVVAIACGFEHSIVLKADGTVVAWGLNSFGQTTVPSAVTGVKLIAANEYFNLAAYGEGTGGGSTGGGGTTTTFPAAPTNLVGYRGKTGSVYQFTVTGANRGAVWGTDVYTDDSSVATAAVHAGVLAAGETKTVTVTLLPGQSSYAASARNGVSSASWGSWSGSYSFAGAGAVTGVPVATARPAAAPGFVATTTTLAAGGRLVCPVNVTGGGTYTYRWYLNGTLIPGATANPYIVESLTAANTGTYAADVTNALGTTRITAGTVTVGAAGSPVLALQPIPKTVVPGGTFTLATSASGTGLTYQWLRNGTQLAGETGAILLRQNVTAADEGNYSVRVSNAAGSVVSNAATITLSAAASRPANISVRTNVATGATVIPGFYVQGSGTKRVLIRAVGPGLATFGVGGVMADPKFAVYQGSTKVAENDDWSAANIGNAFAATGAFAVGSGSKDAALVTDLAAGRDYTVQVTNASGQGGVVLIEVYDADILTGRSTSKLVNVSVRGQTAPGESVLTLGLVIGGNGPRTLLVRGIGPKLATFGVTGAVADPSLQIFDSQQRAILANNDWSSADFVSELVLATQYVGAFALDAGSKDAATLSLVEPGAYTIQVIGADAAPSGEALVEVYEVP
jgi:hypothetical protein